MSRFLCLAAFCGSLCSAVVGRAQQMPAQPRIVFFSPNSESNTYWPQVFRIIEHVGQDLGFELVPYSLGVHDRFARQQSTLRLLQTEPRPHAVIVSVVIGHSKPILDAAEALGIPVFILGPLFPSELSGVGDTPRNKYKSWVALFNWAEEQKGYALGKALLASADRAGAVAADGVIQVVGVGGDPSWFGSGLRQAGLERAIAEHPKAVLKQVVPTKWTRAEGKDLTRKLLRRFPEATVVWAASDQLGAGVIDGLAETGKIPGKTTFTGGLDLSDVGMDLVKQGKFVATTASTMLSYAEAVILIYDYLRGMDFSGQLGNELEFPALVATSDNVDQHLRLSRCVGSIDFKKFSRFHDKTLKRYEFSFDAFLDATKTCARE